MLCSGLVALACQTVCPHQTLVSSLCYFCLMSCLCFAWPCHADLYYAKRLMPCLCHATCNTTANLHLHPSSHPATRCSKGSPPLGILSINHSHHQRIGTNHPSPSYACALTLQTEKITTTATTTTYMWLTCYLASRIEVHWVCLLLV